MKKGNTRFGLLKAASKMEVLKDTDPMPDKGRHKGTAMVNIPAGDLLWLYEKGKCSPRVSAYIKSNLEDLQKEAEK